MSAFQSAINSFENADFHGAVIALCRDGIEAGSHDANKLQALAVLNRDRIPEAKAFLSKCLIDDAQVAKMFGIIAFKENKFHEACDYFHRALSLDPDYAQAAHDLSISYSQMERHEDAIFWGEACCKMLPNWDFARMDLGIVRLNAGDEEKGWTDYEARHKAHGPVIHSKNPRWEGEPLSGKRIYLYMEQGFGDQIQYLRYAKKFSDEGARVIVGLHPKLRRYAQLQAGVSEVYEYGGPVNEYDTWQYSISLPRVLNGISSMGGPSSRISRRGKGKGYVGLCWRGFQEHKGTRWRDIPFSSFQPIVRDYKCLRFQFELPEGAPGWAIEDATIGCFDFLDTAMRMLDELDVLVTCDTGIAHLAGSIGLPTIMLLPERADYRWRLCDPSFYYPSVTAITAVNGWDEAMLEARSYVKEIL